MIFLIVEKKTKKQTNKKHSYKDAYQSFFVITLGDYLAVTYS